MRFAVAARMPADPSTPWPYADAARMMIDGVLALTLVALVQCVDWPTYTFGPPLRDTARTDILGLLQSVELYQLHERGRAPEASTTCVGRA